ncbi:hypothetical protein T439DRAFT_383074 [Meredithblackwellia eburnea MCA 4105]
MSLTSSQLRFRARQLYKELLYMSREYNQGLLPDYPIHERLRRCFGAFVGADDDKVREGIKKAEFIQKELEALYFLRKYRAMKRRFGE